MILLQNPNSVILYEVNKNPLYKDNKLKHISTCGSPLAKFRFLAVLKLFVKSFAIHKIMLSHWFRLDRMGNFFEVVFHKTIMFSTYSLWERDWISTTIQIFLVLRTIEEKTLTISISQLSGLKTIFGQISGKILFIL